MLDPLTLSLVASTAASAGGSILGGISQRKASEAAAAQKRRAIAELTARKNINLEDIQRTSSQERSDINLSTISSGFSADTSLSSLNESLANEFRNVRNLERETSYEIASKRAEIEATLQEGRDAETAGYLGAAGSILSGWSSFERSGGVNGMNDRINKGK